MSGDIEWPDEFPTAGVMRDMLLSAVRGCISTNMLRPLENTIEPILGSDKSIFNSSIAYRDIGLSGSTDLFKGWIPIKQLIGKILYDSEVMSIFLNSTGHCVINANSMRHTRAHRSSTDLSIIHTMKDSPLLRRYLSMAEVRFTDREDGLTDIILDVPYDSQDMSGLLTFAASLRETLSAYYKLLTRFETCQSYSNAFPTFQTS